MPGQFYQFQVEAVGGDGTVTGSIGIYTFLALPVGPIVAPPIDMTIPTTIYSAYSFLVSGANPVVYGATISSFDPKRVSPVYGHLQTVAGDPVVGARIGTLNHPEYGVTFSDSNGDYHMLVNGDGTTSITIDHPSFLSVQRKTQLQWNVGIRIPTVVMTVRDPKSTPIDFTASVTQVAVGSASTDADGTRQPVFLVPPNVQPVMHLPNGTTAPVTNGHIRMTEYTVGPTGPQAMPADLPPTSEYTYALNVELDEAAQAGATSVTFSSLATLYVDNFLNFPVGVGVPTGSFNVVSGNWVPTNNGVVIKILSVSGGVASIDVSGSGVAASSATLTTLGITNDELTFLAQTYHAGKTLWRMTLPHLSPWDGNWGVYPSTGSTFPNAGVAPNNPPFGCQRSGSIIECEKQLVRESIPIPFTGLTFNYNSQRTPGWIASHPIQLNVTGSQIPSNLQSVTVLWSVAGQQFEQTITPPTPNLVVPLTWGGTDFVQP